MSYRKVGGIHFVKLGRFGFNFYVSKPKARPMLGMDHLLTVCV